MKLFNLETPKVSFSETKLRLKIIAILATFAVILAATLQCSAQSSYIEVTRSDIIAEVKWLIDHYDISHEDLEIDCPENEAPLNGIGEFEVTQQYGEFKGHYLTLLRALDIYDLNQYIYRGNVGRIKDYLPVELEPGDRIKFLFIKTNEQ